MSIVWRFNIAMDSCNYSNTWPEAWLEWRDYLSHTSRSQWGLSSVQGLLLSTALFCSMTMQLHTFNCVVCSGAFRPALQEVMPSTVKTHWYVWWLFRKRCIRPNDMETTWFETRFHPFRTIRFHTTKGSDIYQILPGNLNRAKVKQIRALVRMHAHTKYKKTHKNLQKRIFFFKKQK